MCLSLLRLLQQKYHRLGDLNNRLLFLTVQAGSPKSRSWRIWCLMRPHFLVDSGGLSFCCVFPWLKALEGSSGISYIRALIPLMKASPSWPNHLLKAPPNTMALGVMYQHVNFGETQLFSSYHYAKVFGIYQKVLGSYWKVLNRERWDCIGAPKILLWGAEGEVNLKTQI